MVDLAATAETLDADRERGSAAIQFTPSHGQPSRMRVWSGQRLLGRALAVPFDYADLYADPEAARRGEFNPHEVFLATTCAANGGEDDT